MAKQKLLNAISHGKAKANELAYKGETATMAAAAYAAVMMGNMGFCDSKGALSAVFGALAIPIALLGAVFAVFGVVHYAAAKQDGDGPATNKAVQQIGAGAMVIAIGLTLKTFGPQIVNAIS